MGCQGVLICSGSVDRLKALHDRLLLVKEGEISKTAERAGMTRERLAALRRGENLNVKLKTLAAIARFSAGTSIIWWPPSQRDTVSGATPRVCAIDTWFSPRYFRKNRISAGASRCRFSTSDCAITLWSSRIAGIATSSSPQLVQRSTGTPTRSTLGSPLSVYRWVLLISGFKVRVLGESPTESTT